MKAVKSAVISAKEQLEIRSFPLPGLGRGEMLIKVEMCGICGSDLHIFRGDWGEPYPLIPGHEFIGRVAQMGEGAAERHQVRIGDRVAVEMILPCWECEYCKAGRYNLCLQDRSEGRQYGCNISMTRAPSLYGGWSEYLFVPPNAIVHRIPEHVPLRRAVLVEPLAVAVRAVHLTPPRLGDCVAVIGAGPIGLLTAVAAKAAGAGCVILVGTREERLALGKELAADFAVDFRQENAREKVRAYSGGRGADIVFETAGTVSGQIDSLHYARTAGVVNYVGLTGNKTVPIHTDAEMTFKEVKLQTSFLSAGAYQAAIRIISGGRYPIEKLITHEFSLDQAYRGLQCAANRDEKAIKVILVPDLSE
ncbi:zinc-binding dehydrogenase [Brevibacillus sp. B_LB10_24]|uniref:zinc-dependent alcohol dehydrogenase n=1 Tax=Brevibacillus sp. B_LB10_24 TaxID=3380645 RepID=UPI0038BC8287